jgi:hypothetical protein
VTDGDCLNGALDHWRRQNHDRQHSNPSQRPGCEPVYNPFSAGGGCPQCRDRGCDAGRYRGLNNAVGQRRIFGGEASNHVAEDFQGRRRGASALKSTGDRFKFSLANWR